ncbi:MAG TPA: epoxide hydrolase [Gemmatimonadales bacterium]|nr:epoxide hydrolase [Gemmatimonadales bacterium]
MQAGLGAGYADRAGGGVTGAAGSPVLPELRPTPYAIRVEDDVLDDLRTRIRRTRWPDQLPGIGWEQGTELGYLRELLAYWADGFDWRARERELNDFHHYRAELDGLGIHFVHERGTGRDAVPLVLTHGWPSTFLELLPLVPLLTNPAAHGLDAPAFDVVIPSLPGYGFSDRPARQGMTMPYVAGLWHRLMHGLGYERYGAVGGDFGAAVSAYLGRDHPGSVIGIHLYTLDVAPYAGPGARPLTEVEAAYDAYMETWWRAEGGYKQIQATKPGTVGYGLNDSPAGLAAWLIEKWRSWGGCAGDVERGFSRDFLLSTLTIYWATQTITSSMRTYYDDRRLGPVGPHDYVGVPTAVAVFNHMTIPEGVPPREWVERLYAVRRWTEMPRGGHFAACEEPELLARDIGAFFGELCQRRE